MEGRSAVELMKWIEVGVEEIEVREVLLVRCEGRPEEWRVIGRLPL